MLQTEISVRFVEIDGELCVLCIGRDITKRRLAEAALKESEEKFARIFTGSPDGIVIISLADNRILDINDAFVASSGFSYEEIVGHRVSDLPIFDDIEQLKRSTEIVREGRQPAELRTDVPHEERRTDSGAGIGDGRRTRRRKKPRLHRERQPRPARHRSASCARAKSASAARSKTRRSACC